MHVSANTNHALFPIADPGKFDGCKPTAYEPHERAGFRKDQTAMQPASTLSEGMHRMNRGQVPVIYGTIIIGILGVLFLIGYAVGQYRANSEAVAAVERAAKPVPLKGTIIGNYDGDTVTVQINVRLAEIDAPELRQEYGPESKAVLASLLPPKTAVLIRQDTVDRYGRMVAHINHADRANPGWMPGTFSKPPSLAVDMTASYRMVLKGAAWQYSDYSKDQNLTNAQTFASNTSAGLWGANLPPLPPWEFRKRPAPKREVLPFPGNLPENPFRPIPQSTGNRLRQSMTDVGEIVIRPETDAEKAVRERHEAKDTMPCDERHYDGGIRAGYYRKDTGETPH